MAEEPEMDGANTPDEAGSKPAEEADPEPKSSKEPEEPNPPHQQPPTETESPEPEPTEIEADPPAQTSPEAAESKPPEVTETSNEKDDVDPPAENDTPKDSQPSETAKEEEVPDHSGPSSEKEQEQHQQESSTKSEPPQPEEKEEIESPRSANITLPVRTGIMKAAIATGIKDFDEYIHVHEFWPQPTLATAKDGKTGKQVLQLSEEKHMIVKVLACAVAPGDCRLFKGKTDLMQLPMSGRPYVIGSDICGIVTEVAEDESYYKVGDKIIARFDEPQAYGMCAEYACVKTHLSEKCPASIPATLACTLASSASAAKLVAEKFIQKDSRVLLLGGSGGLGTFMCQYIRKQGASFLAATTTQSELVKSLGVDRVIDYRVENWWELEKEFGENPFDVVVDLVNGQNWQKGACSGTTVLKSKLPYVQLLSGVETEIDMGMGYISMVPFVFTILGRSLYAKLHWSCPTWEVPQGLELKPGHLKALLEDIAEKRIRVVLDPASPFEFTTDGVRAAMKLQNSIHAHGKVVIEIAKEESSD